MRLFILINYLQTSVTSWRRRATWNSRRIADASARIRHPFHLCHWIRPEMVNQHGMCGVIRCRCWCVSIAWECIFNYAGAYSIKYALTDWLTWIYSLIRIHNNIITVWMAFAPLLTHPYRAGIECWSSWQQERQCTNSRWWFSSTTRWWLGHLSERGSYHALCRRILLGPSMSRYELVWYAAYRIILKSMIELPVVLLCCWSKLSWSY